MKLIFLLLISFTAEAKGIAFDQALKEIIKRDTNIPQEEAFLRASQSNARSKMLSFLPDLTAGFNKQKNRINTSEFDRFDLTASVNIFKFGADYASYQAANRQLDSRRSSLSQSKLTAEATAIEVLITNILRSKEVQILEKILKAKESSLKTFKARFQRGLTPSTEVDKARVEVNNAKARYNNSLLQLDTARGLLIALLGHADVKMDWPWKQTLKKKDHSKLKGQFKLKERPDYRQAQFDLAFREASAKSAVRAFFPKVDFSYSWSETDFYTSSINERTSLLSISIPLFNGWRGVSDYETQKALSEQARYRLVRIERDASSEWKTKQINFDISIQTAKDREVNLALSRRVYRSTVKRFNKGRVTINELSQDQSRLLDSESLSAAGWAQAHLSLVELCHTRGKTMARCLKTQ
ncbi:MAG: outer membrane protein TolC [Bacteriovoracaceae bacterium]